jgi:hypothetical protein
MSLQSRLGKIAELKFNTICIERGLACLWPSVDVHGYDCVIDSNGRLYRVQIKSTINVHISNRGYDEVKFNISKSKRGSSCYDISDFDFLACYSHRLDQWWIMPIEESAVSIGSKSFSIYPNRKNSKYTKFQNAWHLLD